MLKNGAAESSMLEKIRHVETATDKKRHVEGMKKGMLKNGVPESGMLKLLRKKRHVEGKKQMLKNSAGESGMLKKS